MDGYQALKAFLPPKERRGLSSSIRRSTVPGIDRRQGARGSAPALRNGVHALWYPLMEPLAMRAFERGLVETGIRKILQSNCPCFRKAYSEGMRDAVVG